MHTRDMNTTTQTKSPAGVTGKQRQMFLSLTEAQREVYRYHFDSCGRYADTCYHIAVGELAL